MSAGGFTDEEMDALGLNREKGVGGGNSGRENGNVYLDGVIVGQVASSAASYSSIDGLPAATIQRLGPEPPADS
jgi:hypothetical protein